MKAWKIILSAFTLLGSAGSPAMAEDPQRSYDARFGAEAWKVSITNSTKDDVAFAKKLLAGAESSAGAPKLQALLYEKAYEFAMKDREGCAVAAEAMKRLAEVSGDKKADAEAKMLGAYRLQYTRSTGEEKKQAGVALMDVLTAMAADKAASGQRPEAILLYRRAILLAEFLKSDSKDGIQSRLDAALARQNAEARIAALVRKLKANPDDAAAARQLVLVYVVECDDPSKAVGYLAATRDRALKTHVPLAAKDVKDVPESTCLALGHWYKGLAGQAGTAAKPTMLLRAKACYERFIESTSVRDAQKAKAKLALREISAAVDAGGPAAQVSPPKPTGNRPPPAPPTAEAVDAALAGLKQFNRGREVSYHLTKRAGAVVGLRLEGNPDLTSVAPLAGLSLSSLKLGNCKSLRSVKPLRGMPLQELDLSCCESLRSLRGIEGMPLTRFRLDRCKSLTSIEPLKGMKLRNLALQGCASLTSLASIEHMPLTSLDLRDCRSLRGLEKLKGMKLQSLDLSGCRSLRSLSGIEGMPLTRVRLDRCESLTSIAPLKGMKLRDLGLRDCLSLRSLKGLEDMPLTNINISGCASLTDLGPLSGTKLMKLNLDRCASLISLRGIEDLPLTELSLSRCQQLRNLTCLKGMKLRKLRLEECVRLTSLEGLEGMPLTELNLHKCIGLRDIQPLKGLRLTSLRLSDCTSLTSLRGIEGMPLVYLNLRGTKFTSLKLLAELKRKIPSLQKVEQ